MVMTKTEFTDPETPGWWMCQNPVSQEVERKREEIQRLIPGAGEDWYQRRDALEHLWEVVEAPGLLDELERAGDDETKKLEWLDHLIQAINPEQDEDENEEEQGTGPTAPTAPVTQAPVPPVQAKRPSLFAKKNESESVESESVESESVESGSGESGSVESGSPLTPPSQEKKPGLFSQRQEPDVGPAAAAPPAEAVTPPAALDTAAAAEVAEVLDKTELPEETKKALETFVADTTIPVSAGEVAKVVEEYGDDFQKIFAETEEGLDKEIEDLFAELDDEDEDEDESEEVAL
jgi:hypothetical protein